MDERQRLAMLAMCSLFAAVPEQELLGLAASATVRRYRRGQLLFCEGDVGDSLLIVAEGRFKAYSTSPDGEEFLLAVVNAGDSLGEVSIADGGTRSATVEAMTDAVTLRLPREAVLTVAARSPALTAAILRALASVVRRVTGTAADLVFLDLPRRVAKLIVDEHRSTGEAVIDMPLNQSEIAHRVGASRQSVNTALRDFQRRGWITTSGHEIRIRDLGALSRFVDV